MTVRMSSNAKRRMGCEIAAVVRPTYFSTIPLMEIFKPIEAAGFVVLQEDFTKWAGLLCGREAHAYFSLGCNPDDDGVYEEVTNAMLAMSWYQMSSGRYEVLAYIT